MKIIKDHKTLRLAADKTPTADCVLNAPLGELIGDMAFRLVVLRLNDAVKHVPLTGEEGFDAQGLEGGFELPCTLAAAWVLTKKSPVSRWRVLVAK